MDSSHGAFLNSPHIKTGSQPTANRSIGRAAFHAIARSLRRAMTDSARAWALAAGVPPDLYN